MYTSLQGRGTSGQEQQGRNDMDFYIFQADTYCQLCASGIKARLDPPPTPEDEWTFDSDEYPKGAFDSDYEESDSPDHCASCQIFLKNPLTSDGEAYIRELALEDNIPQEWREFYSYLWGVTNAA